MKSRCTALVALLFAWSGTAFAHETGSHKKIMGEVRSIDDREIVVKTTEGKERTVRLDSDTECRDEQSESSCSAVRSGNRVVVITRDESGVIVADEIRFSSRAKKGSGKASAPHRGHKQTQGIQRHPDE